MHDRRSRDDLKELETFFGIKMREVKSDQIGDALKMLKNSPNMLALAK